ncbi:hypothetical protein F9L07_25345 [Pimelobacter simplex]|uniref:Terminase n=2 Tax=Nocardioides simplex TaxID=2045 RepID=A0A7J5DSM8_NOCSI|nr:hypothetical protein [Pimelobacter simplex]KAB2807997.1 hypothetical protein F9L07_25345 [Pimelobacter simplex]
MWLNRWVKAGRQAFDVKRWGGLATADPIAAGSFVTWGFDGARYRDSTAIVLTDIPTGRQRLWALWEKPLTADDKWEITEQQVLDSLDELHDTFSVWRGYYDPFYWTEAMRKAAGKYGDKVVVEWRTNRTLAAAWMARRYGEAISGGDVTRCKDDPLAEDFDRHIAAAGRETVNHWDDQGEQLFILAKIHPDRKFDVAMAAQLSWEARLDALKAGAQPDDGPTYFRLPR